MIPVIFLLRYKSQADIAVKAGIGKGTIYQYFTSKEDLFFAVFEGFKPQTGAAAKVNIAALGGSATSRLIALSDFIKFGSPSC